jgi:hypothetical protein
MIRAEEVRFKPQQCGLTHQNWAHPIIQSLAGCLCQQSPNPPPPQKKKKRKKKKKIVHIVRYLITIGCNIEIQ